MMFAYNNRVKSTLISGSKEAASFIMFESAIHWAEEGHRIIYIAPELLQTPLLKHHDRSNPGSETLKLMRFMYPLNYEALVEQLVDLHNFACVPSVLLLDNIDVYINDPEITEEKQVHIARLCALLSDTMNACAASLQEEVHLCVSTNSVDYNKIYQIYFEKMWKIEEEDDKQVFKIKDISACSCETKIFEYCRFNDNNIILRRIFYSKEN